MSLPDIRYPNCSHKDHAYEPLSMMCVHKNCDKKSAICCICEFEQHRGHQTMPIKQLLHSLNKFAHPNPLSSIQQIKQLKSTFFKKLKQIKDDILQSIQKQQKLALQYFQNCQDTIIGLHKITQPLPELVQLDETLFKNYFENIVKLPSDDLLNVKQRINGINKQVEIKVKKILTTSDFLKNQINKIVKVNQVILSSKQKQYQVIWSQTLKGSKMKITGPVIEQTGMESSGQRFSMAQYPLQQNSISKWSFKIKKFVAWVGIGICLGKHIKNANYYFHYTNIGHGSYIISSNGYCWSHSKKQDNSVSKLFNFTTNDVIHIEYDPINSKLKFKKNSNEKFQMDIVPPPIGDNYYPCVNLCSNGDSVQILPLPASQI